MDTLAQLYRRHAALVWRTLRIARVPMMDIDDLAHDIFLIIRRKLPTYSPSPRGASPEDQERAWIYTIAAYEAKNYRAKRTSRQQVLMDITDEIPDERSDSARLEAQDELLVLLDSLTLERRQVFALIEIEGFTAPEVAAILHLSESNVNRLLRLAREDLRAEAVRRDHRAPTGDEPKSRALLLPFGVGAWSTLRDALNPSADTTARVWRRLEATIAHLDDDNDRITAPPSSPPRPPRGRLTSMGRHLQGALGHFLSALVGGAIMACLLLSRPTASIAVLRIPIPLLVATSSTSSPGPVPSGSDGSTSLLVGSTASAAPLAETPVNPEELLSIRQAHVALTAGDLPKAIAALKAYDAKFPEGRYKKDAQSLWTRIRQQSGNPTK